MGRIPEYNRTSFQSSVNTGMIGNSQSDMVARSVGTLANAGFDMVQKQKRIQDETYVAKKAMELETKSDEVFQSWQKEHEADPLGKEDILKERLERVREELLADAPSGTAQQEFGNVTDRYYQNVHKNAGKWQDEQLKTNTVSSVNEGFESQKIKILRNPNPQNFQTLMAEGEMLLNPLREAAGTAAANDARQKYASNLSLTMFESLVQKNNLGSASQLLRSQQYDKHLGAEGIERVQKLIDLKQEQNNSLSKKIENLKDKDPWDYYLHKGGTANPIAFNPADDPTGQMLRDTLIERQAIVDGAMEKMGLELPLLTPRETDGLIKTMVRMDTDSNLQFFKFYNQSLTEDQQVNLSRHVFQKEPSMGIALSISNDAPEDAQSIIVGAKLLREEKGTPKLTSVFAPKPGAKDVDVTFDDYLGNATEDAQFRKQLKSAAMAHYTAKSLRSSKAVNSFDPEMFQESIAAVSAPVADINGKSVFLFRDTKTNKFVDADEFEDFMEDLSDEHIEKIQGDVPRNRDGNPINMQKASDQVTLQTRADGKYYVMFQGQMTRTKSGDEFILDAKKLFENKPKNKSLWDRIFD